MLHVYTLRLIQSRVAAGYSGTPPPLQSLLGNPEALSDQTGFVIPPASPDPTQGPSVQTDVPRTPSKGRWSGCIPIRCPNHLRLLLSMPRKCSDSTPSSLWMSDLFTSSPRQIPTALCKKLIFTAGMPNPVHWGHCSELMPAGEGFDIDRPLLYTSFNRTCVTGDVKPQYRLLISTFHWLKN